MTSLAQFALSRGGTVKPLVIPSEFTGGTGLFNPTILVDDGKIYANIRHCQYTLYHAELNRLEHQWGPLLYLNPENDMTLTTTNYFCELNADLDIAKFSKVDTSKLDKQPLWEFVGLEDARLIKWEGKMYLCGVRRDTTKNGEGRMELSEIEISQNSVREISRFRIPTPGNKPSYCEKNWMPINSKPYHFVKWTSPTEIVKFDPVKNTTSTIYQGISPFAPYDLRGGSQVLKYKNFYVALNHITYLYRSEQNRKDATYRHQFVVWDEDWNVIKTSPIFSFMDAKIEFCCGMAKHEDSYLFTFGYQDNSAFVLRLPDAAFQEIIDV